MIARRVSPEHRRKQRKRKHPEKGKIPRSCAIIDIFSRKYWFFVDALALFADPRRSRQNVIACVESLSKNVRPERVRETGPKNPVFWRSRRLSL
jgi:hypothetical protein